MTGIIRTLSMDNYRVKPGLSKHQLDAFSIAPSYYKWKLSQEFKPSKAMELGTLVHAQALENRIEYAIGPDVDRRTTDGKKRWAAFCAENINHIIVTQAEATIINGACEAVKPLLDKIEIVYIEASMFWERDGVECKGRPDAIGTYNGYPVIVDLKTVTGMQNFDSSFFRLRYDVQAEWYLHGINKIEKDAYKFAFLVVDMEQPHLTQFVFPSTELLADATSRVDTELELFKECQESGVWPGMPESRIIFNRYV